MKWNKLSLSIETSRLSRRNWNATEVYVRSKTQPVNYSARIISELIPDAAIKSTRYLSRAEGDVGIFRRSRCSGKLLREKCLPVIDFVGKDGRRGSFFTCRGKGRVHTQEGKRNFVESRCSCDHWFTVVRRKYRRWCTIMTALPSTVVAILPLLSFPCSPARLLRLPSSFTTDIFFTDLFLIYNTHHRSLVSTYIHTS